MKKIFMLLIIIAAAFSVSAQETVYWTAYRTQLVRKYKWQLEWETVSNHYDASINIAMTGNTLQVNAERASVLVIDTDTKRVIDNEKLEMVNYQAFEVVKKRNCQVDFVLIKKTNELILGVTYDDEDTKYALHYFITKNQ